MKTAHVVLVPGFFGFGRLGDISYFTGVAEALASALARHDISISVTEVLTPPTASIRKRAAHVLEALAEVARRGGDIHLIGHSTGALDARLAIAETASLPTAVRFDAYERVRSLVSVSAPHYGTNVSTYFTRPLGRALFRTTCRYLVFMLERGRLPLKIMLRLGYWVVRLRDPRRRRRGTFDQLYDGLLNDLSESRRLELVQFLRQIAAEQALLFQLTPAGCDLLNACTLDPPVAYGSVVTCAAPPRLRTLLRSMWSLYSQIMYPLYWVLHRLSREPGDQLREVLTAEQLSQLDAGLARPATGRDSDGLVPVLSQAWGRVLHVARADHLDVVGQYGSLGEKNWSGDWLPSESGFDATAFDAVWQSVADFIAEASATASPETPGAPGVEPAGGRV